MDWLYALTEEPFYELAFILMLAAVIGALGNFLKKPMMTKYMAEKDL
jgi:hypothetical protein